MANWIDQFIGMFSPRAQVDRMRYRYAARMLERKYEGASKGRRTKWWNASNSSAPAESAGVLPTLRARSRDLVRNNPYAARGIDVIVANVVGGRGIVTDIKNIESQERKDAIQRAWNAWSQTTACDFEGRLTFAGMQRLVMRAVAEGGEIVVRRRFLSRAPRVIGPDGVEVQVPPVQLQLLEGDHLDSTMLDFQNPKSGNQIIQGIEFDSQGRRVAYHLLKSHPGSSYLFKTGKRDTVRLPVDEVRHVFRPDRAGQIRGIPWLAPVIIRMRDFDEYEDAQLMRQKIASLFCAFVQDTEGIEDSETEEEKALGEKMEPAQIEFLPPGRSVTLANPPTVENYKEYASVMLHSFAAGLGITFESMTTDYGEVNFSSARMGHLDMQRNIDTWQRQIMIDQFAQPTFDWFVSGLPFIGLDSAGVDSNWTPPRREMVDPTKEIPATIKAIRGGVLTLSEAIKQTGRDPEAFVAEYKKDYELLDKHGVKIEADVRNDVKPKQDSGNQSQT